MATQALVRGLLKKWSLPEAPPVAVSPNGFEPLAARVLAARGFTDPDVCHEFLEPALKGLHDPSLIPDLDRAARRLLDAARAGEPIVIYGDYDVDGITATAILFHTLRAVVPGADVRTYIPHRLEEGYGLNTEAVVELARGGARVIVSVDCGITAVEPALAARAEGADLIITDHHNPPETLEEMPDAFAVVHPRRPDSKYPFGDLPGAGVAYKLAWRLATMRCGSERVTPELRKLLVEMLALASLGVIADVVPLVGENRIIARHGLARVKHSSILGLRALVEASGLAGENVQADHVGFRLGPRLNACGRMGHAREAVELLTVADKARAEEIARELSRLNDARRRTEQQIAEQAAELAQARGMTGPGCRAIVLAHEGWHPGVVGIVCSRLVERFGRPTILLCTGPDGRECSGSGRSIDGFNLHGALSRCSRWLASFGGHDMAAGLKLSAGDLDAFTQDFLGEANAALADEDLVPSVRIDCDAAAGELTSAAVRQLERLAPFGRGNPRVRVRLQGLRVQRPPALFGGGGRHASLIVEAGPGGPVHGGRPAHNGRAALRLVGWDWGRHAASIPAGSVIDAVVTPEISSWGGGERVEPVLHDVLVAPTAAR